MFRFMPITLALLVLSSSACKESPPPYKVPEDATATAGPKGTPIVPGIAGGQITGPDIPSAPATEAPHHPTAVNDAPAFFEKIGTTPTEVQKIAVQQTAQPIALNFATTVVAQTVQTNNVTGTMWDITGNFIPGFLWGVAVAAHQVEGFNTNNDWWMFETFCNGFWEAVNTCFPKFIRDSGRASDHYSLFADSDLDRARDLGSNTFRMSIEWSRIEPQNGVYSASATAYYRDYLTKVRARGMKPMVTLWHFTLPQWAQKPGVYYDFWGRHDNMDQSLGGWQNPVMIQKFANFAKYCAQNFGDLVDIWVTHNEPVGNIMVGYMAGFFPPGYLLNFSGTKTALLNLTRAHNSAYDMIHRYDTVSANPGPAAQVGLVQHFRYFRPNNPNDADDMNAFKKLDYFYHYHMLDGATSGRIDTNWDGNGDEVVSGSSKLDFIGVNYYSTYMVGPKYAANLPFFLAKAYPELGHTPYIPDNNSASVPHNSLGWEIYPAGFYDTLMKVKNRYHLPIMITENGMADVDGSTNKRAQYIISHLQMALKAYRDGADIRGYYLWTLTDNFEWREAFRNEAHFGLYHVNTNGRDVSDTSDSLARSPTAAVAAFRAIVTNNGISQSHINTYGSFPQLPKP